MTKTRASQIIINSALGISHIGDVHWQNLGVTRHIQEKLFETQIINYYYYYYYYYY